MGSRGSPGDEPLAVNSKPVARSEHLQALWDSLRTADEVTALLPRGDRPLEVRLTAGPAVESPALAGRAPPAAALTAADVRGAAEPADVPLLPTGPRCGGPTSAPPAPAPAAPPIQDRQVARIWNPHLVELTPQIVSTTSHQFSVTTAGSRRDELSRCAGISSMTAQPSDDSLVSCLMLL